MSAHSKRQLHDRIASDLLSQGVSVVSRWDALRAYSRERFTDALYEEMVQGIESALDDYGEVRQIMTTGHDNNHQLVFIPKHLKRVYRVPKA